MSEPFNGSPKVATAAGRGRVSGARLALVALAAFCLAGTGVVHAEEPEGGRIAANGVDYFGTSWMVSGGRQFT